MAARAAAAPDVACDDGEEEEEEREKENGAVQVGVQGGRKRKGPGVSPEAGEGH